MIAFPIPKVYQQFRDVWARDREGLLAAYLGQEVSFVPNLLPEEAVQLTAEETLRILRGRLGSQVDDALARTGSGPTPSLPSPVAAEPDGSWLKTSNMVGVNVRTIGSFWNVVKYALTLPRALDSIHLLPIWEPGVVGSLYGISSWQINTEFFSQELAAACPALNTVEKQLRVVVNLLHALGKAVGMDVIPHTDRFSEIALAQPHYFEWLQRQDSEIVDHSDNLHEAVQDRILDFLACRGPAVHGEDYPDSRREFFSPAFPEEKRLRVLFGRPEDRAGREVRRNQLVKHLYAYGFEPVPATMAPPFRGIRVNPDTSYTDSEGNVWYDYSIAEPQSMSRVFGPLARYKLYGRLDDNARWEIDFDRPRREVWRYVCDKYADVQHRFGFDFMRGDMSHVQMRPGGVPEIIDDYYDILRAVKRYIQMEKGIACFGYFAETFLAPRNIMVYGDEVDHLEASDADVTLGDLQSTAVGSPEFLQRFRWYCDLRATRSFAPSFTVITGDKDDPRFDRFYLSGNALRLFIATFLTDLPSYAALGFETRDIHHHPAPNEHYTKLYVFQEKAGPKATAGPYCWGQNGSLFHSVTRLRLYAEGIFAQLRGRPTLWLIPPDATGENKHIVWTQGDGRADYVFVANTGAGHAIQNFNIPPTVDMAREVRLVAEFSTAGSVPESDRCLELQSGGYKVMHLAPSEGRVYRCATNPE
ncbi:MAG: hypothetical protein P8189_24505 [Anaerolineae bacterium]